MDMQLCFNPTIAATNVFAIKLANPPFRENDCRQKKNYIFRDIFFPKKFLESVFKFC